MAIYRGIIKGNIVELVDTVRLPDGLSVKIYTEHDSDDDETLENLVEERLREHGLLTTPPLLQVHAPYLRHKPITINGAPLSETIIAERR